MRKDNDTSLLDLLPLQPDAEHPLVYNGWNGQIAIFNESQIQQSMAYIRRLSGHSICMDSSFFLMCTAGKLDLLLDLEPCQVESGQLLVVIPGKEIVVQQVSDDFNGVLVVTGSQFTDGLQLSNPLATLLTLASTPVRTIKYEAMKSIETLCAMFGRLVTLNDLPNQRHVLELIVELMFYTMGYYLHPPKAIKKSSADFLTDQFVQLVDSDHRSHHQLEHYAQQLNVSAKYLAECVKQTTQRTATNWIEARLLADAKHLLNSNQMSIKEIANTLNFASQSNFGRFFKRLTGTSPLAYRKRH